MLKYVKKKLFAIILIHSNLPTDNLMTVTIALQEFLSGTIGLQLVYSNILEDNLINTTIALQ